MIFWPIRLALRVVSLVLALLVVYFGVTLVQVWLTSRHYEARAATSIVVMGAAQYDGVPSPDLRARLNEARLLFREGYSHLIVVTGSKEKADRFTEAETGFRYLRAQGIPAGDISQAGGHDSYQNLADAAPIVKAHGGKVVLVVTDPFHEDRSLAIATNQGLTPYPTPTETSPIAGWSTVPYFLKEAAGVGLGRVIGFRHLNQLHADLG